MPRDHEETRAWARDVVDEVLAGTLSRAAEVIGLSGTDEEIVEQVLRHTGALDP